MVPVVQCTAVQMCTADEAMHQFGCMLLDSNDLLPNSALLAAAGVCICTAAWACLKCLLSADYLIAFAFFWC